MNIICDKSKLIEGINIALKAIPGKSTMAILECLVLEVKDNIIKLIANDLEIGIETIIDGQIIEEGSVAINAKVFFEIIRKLPSDEVTISVDDNYVMNISGGKAKFNISVKPTEEFPFLPQIVKNNNITISQFSLKEVIRQTVFSISDNGLGMDAKECEYVLSLDNDGIGLKNIHERLQLCYGPSYGLTISSKKGIGTTVHVRLGKKIHSSN